MAPSIFESFRRHSWSGDLVEMVDQMLEEAAEMFGYDVAMIVYGEPDEDPQGEILDRDFKIERLQQEIRRRVVSHLALPTSPEDVPTTLVILHAVRDVERIGDLLKDLHEVHSLMPGTPDRKIYQEYLVGRSRTVEDLFVITQEAFREGDRDMADQVIQRAGKMGEQADQAIREVTLGDLDTRDAVCLALSLRYYKRIVMHMSNVVTTVVSPLDQLDQFDEP
jgi:phosphate uptake regulator